MKNMTIFYKNVHRLLRYVYIRHKCKIKLIIICVHLYPTAKVLTDEQRTHLPICISIYGSQNIDTNVKSHPEAFPIKRNQEKKNVSLINYVPPVPWQLGIWTQIASHKFSLNSEYIKDVPKFDVKELQNGTAEGPRGLEFRSSPGIPVMSHNTVPLKLSSRILLRNSYCLRRVVLDIRCAISENLNSKL